MSDILLFLLLNDSLLQQKYSFSLQGALFKDLKFLTYIKSTV